MEKKKIAIIGSDKEKLKVEQLVKELALEAEIIKIDQEPEPSMLDFSSPVYDMEGIYPSSGLTRKQIEQVTEPVRREPKIGRNDLCPCGSGKKYKKCCL